MTFILALEIFAIWFLFEVPIVAIAALIAGDGQIESIFNKHFAG